MMEVDGDTPSIEDGPISQDSKSLKTAPLFQNSFRDWINQSLFILQSP
jgi:hypothetical protein